MAQLVGVLSLSHRLKGHRFDSWSGHIPRLQVRSLVGMHMRRQSIDASLTSMFLSFSQSNEKMSSGEDKTQINKVHKAHLDGCHVLLNSWLLEHWLALICLLS